MNACGLAAFAPEESTEASEFVFSLWNSLKGNDVFENWKGGIIYGLLWEEGIFNNQPLVDFVNSQIGNRVVKRKVSFGTADANNAEYAIYDYNATQTMPTDYVMSAIASASIPFAFPHVVRGDRVLIDGGSIWNLDISSAVRRCREIVDKDEDIIIDLYLCSGSSIDEVSDVNKYSVLENFMRGREIKSFYLNDDEIEKTKILYPKVNFRYTIVPSEKLSYSPIPLDFSKSHLDKWFAVGKKDAQNAVKLGPGGYWNVVLDYNKRIKNGEKVVLADMIESKVLEVTGTHSDSL